LFIGRGDSGLEIRHEGKKATKASDPFGSLLTIFSKLQARSSLFR
jgi:hypothetical protein